MYTYKNDLKNLKNLKHMPKKWVMCNRPTRVKISKQITFEGIFLMTSCEEGNWGVYTIFSLLLGLRCRSKVNGRLEGVSKILVLK